MLLFCCVKFYLIDVVMMNDIAHRTIKNPYLRLLLMGLGMVISLLTFGVVVFRPDRAPLKCRGMDIPKEVSVV